MSRCVPKPPGVPWHPWKIDGDIIQVGDRVGRGDEFGTVRAIYYNIGDSYMWADERKFHYNLNLAVIPDRILPHYMARSPGDNWRRYIKYWKLNTLTFHESVSQIDPRFLIP